MIIPIRCFTCGKVVGSIWEEYRKRTQEGEDSKAVLDSLGVNRYCCRRMLISNVELIDEVKPFG